MKSSVNVAPSATSSRDSRNQAGVIRLVCRNQPLIEVTNLRKLGHTALASAGWGAHTMLAFVDTACSNGWTQHMSTDVHGVIQGASAKAGCVRTVRSPYTVCPWVDVTGQCKASRTVCPTRQESVKPEVVWPPGGCPSSSSLLTVTVITKVLFRSQVCPL